MVRKGPAAFLKGVENDLDKRGKVVRSCWHQLSVSLVGRIGLLVLPILVHTCTCFKTFESVRLSWGNGGHSLPRATREDAMRVRAHPYALGDIMFNSPALKAVKGSSDKSEVHLLTPEPSHRTPLRVPPSLPP